MPSLRLLHYMLLNVATCVYRGMRHIPDVSVPFPRISINECYETARRPRTCINCSVAALIRSHNCSIFSITKFERCIVKITRRENRTNWSVQRVKQDLIDNAHALTAQTIHFSLWKNRHLF